MALSLSVNPKMPATAEQVKEVIINQGYVPEDIATYYYESDSGFEDTLISCIAFESDDIHFEFLILITKNKCPVRTVKFTREYRWLDGHSKEITYEVALAVYQRL